MAVTLRRIGVLGCLLLMVAAVAPRAGAHAAYKDSNPPDEGTVSSPPSSVWAEFTEPPSSDSYLRVFDPCGARVDGNDSQSTGYRVTVSMTGTRSGTYRVEWAVISTLDGHPTSGAFTFTSTGGEPCPGEEGEGDGTRAGGRERSGSGDGTGAGAPAEEPPPDAAGETRGGESSDEGAGKKARGGRSRGDVQAPASEEELLGAQDPPAEEAPPKDDVPLDGLVIGLALAVLIGVAGGYIYAGIVGPRR